MSPRSANGLHHLEVGLGYVQLVDLTPKLIVAYLTMRRDRASGPTANRARSLLSHLLRIAVINGYLPSNPISRHKVPPFKESPARIRYLTVEQMKELIGAAEPGFGVFIIAALTTACRRGELIELLWADVAADLSRFTVTHSKNGRARVIPILPMLKRELESLPGIKEREGRVFAHLTYDCIRGMWRRTCRKAGFKVGRDGWRIHDLRHASLSMLASQGMPIPMLAALAGHSSLAMVHRYVAFSPDQIHKEVTSRFPALDLDSEPDGG